MSEKVNDYVTPKLDSPPNPLLHDSVWDMIENEVNKHPHSNKISLMEALALPIKDINEDHLMRACRHFRFQNEWVVEAELAHKEDKRRKAKISTFSSLIFCSLKVH